MSSVAKKSAIAVVAVDTERIIAENLESTKTITHLKLQLAEALTTMDNLHQSHQLLEKKLREAKDEAYAHSAQHQKEVTSLREELTEVTKERDDLTRELETTREERDDARREVTRMKMLSIKQEQRRLSTDTTESTMSIASSMGSGGGGRRGSMLQTFCESSRNLLGGGGSGADAASAANAPAQNRRSSLTVADLQISRRNLMLNQQGNAAAGGPHMHGRRGSVSCSF
jgi:seryl-tRNA synthetase